MLFIILKNTGKQHEGQNDLENSLKMRECLTKDLSKLVKVRVCLLDMK